MAQQQECQHHQPGRAQEAAGAALRSARLRPDKGSREAADAEAVPGDAGDRAAVRGTARHSGRSEGGPDRGLRADHEGCRIPGRGAEAQHGGQSARREGGERPHHRALRHAEGRGREGRASDGEIAMASLIGARLPRLEDHPLLVGKGRYIDDIAAPGAWHAAFVRSPHPHAAIRKLDAAAALALPGVQAVLTLDDLAPALIQRRMLRHSNSGTPLDRYWSFALADGEVSYVGEAVAIVLADNRYLAEDAAALVAVD